MQNLKCPIGLRIKKSDKVGDRIFIEGNSAAALGAVYGGATVCAWYPITPSSSVAEAFTSHCKKYRHDPETGKAKYAIVQGEDELASIGIVIGGIFLFELLLVVGAWVINPTVTKTITAAIPTNVTNTEALGLVLYTKYIHYFQLAGMVLLVAMIGAIVLTLRHKANVKRQNINVQNARTPEMAMAMRKVAPGQGLSDADAAEWVK